MPYDLERALEAEAARKREQADKEKSATEKQSLQQLAELFGKFDALLATSEFEWWLEAKMIPARDAARKDALDITRTPEQRNDAAQQHHALNTLLEGLTSEHTRLKNKLAEAGR